jgi:adenylylsulfate reductase subunit B
MSIRIDGNKCAGCGECADICPGDLISLGEYGRAEITRVENCWGCASCLKECRHEAISFFLGADIGGKGATLTVRDRGEVLEWIFRGPDGGENVIAVNRSASNQY